MRKIVLFLACLLGAMSLSAKDANEEVKDSTVRSYKLGEVEITSKVATSTDSKLLTNKVSADQMQTAHRQNVTDALNLLPGITVTEAGARNEGTVYLRGYSLLQTPVFYDGVPIYVPYDGNVDVNRFTTFDLSQIAVSKSLTSVLYGPNTMGGAINLISRKPMKAFEVRGISGLKYSDEGLNGYNTSVNVGSAHEKYYVMGSLSYMKDKFTTLSKDFEATTYEDGGRRENSESHDFKFSAKAGYTPNATDEYSINVIAQNAQKGIPPSISGGQFRKYPKYDKTSVYYRSKTDLGEYLKLNVGAYYDSYYNIMAQYDDNTYTLQNTKKAFNSVYDDYSLGGFANLATNYFKNNELKFALYEKYDSHKEHNQSIDANSETGQNAVAGEPIQRYLDNTYSIGLEDVYTLNKYLDVIAGLSYSYRGNNKAQDYGTNVFTGEKNVLYNFPTGSDDAFNYQLAAVIHPATDHKIVISASRKSRFASMKERYSSKFGSQIPNPDLGTEFSWAYDITYTGSVSKMFQYEVSLFRNNLDNAIYQVTEGTASDGTPIYQNQNVAKAVFEGYEVSMSLQPVEYITLGTNYSYIYRENKYDKSMKYVDVPNHKVVAYGDFGLPKWDAKLHVGFQACSKRYVTSDGKTLPGFGLLDASLISKVWKGFKVETGVRNLLDKNYYLTVNYPREGRTFYSSVIYNF